MICPKMGHDTLICGRCACSHQRQMSRDLWKCEVRNSGAKSATEKALLQRIIMTPSGTPWAPRCGHHLVSLRHRLSGGLSSSCHINPAKHRCSLGAKGKRPNVVSRDVLPPQGAKRQLQQRVRKIQPELFRSELSWLAGSEWWSQDAWGSCGTDKCDHVTTIPPHKVDNDSEMP